MIVVTGATGKLGRLVVQELLQKVSASEIVAAVRSPEKATELKALGIEVREADYSRPETLRTAFLGAEKVLLISSSEVGQRVAQHTAVIEAAKAAGVSLLAYTSLLYADTTTLVLAPEHKATEEALKASGVPYVLLRNGWYLENHTENLGPALEHGAVLGAAKDGKFSSAARADYADAAVAVLTDEGVANTTFELAGDAAYTLMELAAEVSKQAGKTVVYQDLPAAEFARALAGFGLPEPIAQMLSKADEGAAKGELESNARDLRTLIGRPTTTLVEAVRVALKG